MIDPDDCSEKGRSIKPLLSWGWQYHAILYTRRESYIPFCAKWHRVSILLRCAESQQLSTVVTRWKNHCNWLDHLDFPRPHLAYRTIGALHIYRAPESIAFLTCGSALQPIFPKSQCWCADESGTKFILQIRPPYYWRIEVPAPRTTYNNVTTYLRNVLGETLQLDKTPNPFQESVAIPITSDQATNRPCTDKTGTIIKVKRDESRLTQQPTVITSGGELHMKLLQRRGHSSQSNNITAATPKQHNVARGTSSKDRGRKCATRTYLFSSVYYGIKLGVISIFFFYGVLLSIVIFLARLFKIIPRLLKNKSI